MKDIFHNINLGHIAAGTGELIVPNGTGWTTTTVTSPIALSNGTHILLDNEQFAIINMGAGNNTVYEAGAGALMFLGDGSGFVYDMAGGAAIVAGHGDFTLDLGGGNNTVLLGLGTAPTGVHDRDSVSLKGDNNNITIGDGSASVRSDGNNATLLLGNGNDSVDADGTGNNIVTGNGRNTVSLDDDVCIRNGQAAITANTLHLGNGTNTVFLGGSGDTVFDGSGTDTITALHGAGTVEDLNALGGHDTVLGFNLTNGITLNLTDILAGIASADIAAHLSLTSHSDPHHGGRTDNVLTVSGLQGTATVTLLDSGHLTIPGLLGSSHVIA